MQSRSATLIGATRKKLLLLAMQAAAALAAVLAAPQATAIVGMGDDGGLLSTSVQRACSGGALGRYNVFLGAFSTECDYIGSFETVECDGNGGGVVTGSFVVVLRQQDCV